MTNYLELSGSSFLFVFFYLRKSGSIVPFKKRSISLGLVGVRPAENAGRTFFKL
nr:MAG TPA: hypothetical protein [Caudoviricetes sp.]